MSHRLVTSVVKHSSRKWSLLVCVADLALSCGNGDGRRLNELFDRFTVPPHFSPLFFVRYRTVVDGSTVEPWINPLEYRSGTLFTPKLRIRARSKHSGYVGLGSGANNAELKLK